VGVITRFFIYGKRLKTMRGWQIKVGMRKSRIWEEKKAEKLLRSGHGRGKKRGINFLNPPRGGRRNPSESGKQGGGREESGLPLSEEKLLKGHFKNNREGDEKKAKRGMVII